MLVRYPGDPERIWHERVLLAKVSGQRWVTTSPDFDFETISLADVSVRVMPPDRHLPPGLKERECYLVFDETTKDAFLPPDTVQRLIREGEALASAEREEDEPSFGAEESPDRRPVESRRRLVGKQIVPTGPVAVGSSGDGPPRVWVAAETAWGFLLGQKVPVPEAGLAREGRGLSLLPGGQYLLSRLLTAEERSALALTASPAAPLAEQTESPSDARVLPVLRATSGRHRDFQFLSDECAEEAFEDFPLSGPRTASWCLRYLRTRRSPTEHHLMFRSVARLGPESWGIPEHEHLCQMIEFGGQYDQLDLTNLAMVEAAFRRMQTIEWVYADRVREADGGPGSAHVTQEEMVAFSGLTRTGGALMLCPSLLSHVRTQVETDVGIMKAVRKAKEERDLRRGKKKGGGGKGKEET